MINYPTVPVIMYHSIGIPNKNWQWSALTCPYRIFESHLKWIKKGGFKTISLQDLYAYMKEGENLAKNPIVLTFDDGYLDNWVFAYPLLKKYGFNGTIYVNPEFTDSSSIIRKNLEDFWRGEVEISELQTTGYLSWEEMKEMEAEGVIDIQSHTMSHTWYPASDRTVDFRHPRDQYIWMTWNDNPAKKPYLQIDDKKLVNYGEPVYACGRAIGIRRYFPDENLREFMENYAKEKDTEDFFSSRNWRDELFEVVRKYKERNRLNERYETVEEYEERVYYELQKSKEIIEDKLDKEVRFLCWPGGAVTRSALKMASDIGYMSSTAGKDMISARKHLRNKYGENPSRINRQFSASYWDGIEGFGSRVKYINGFFLRLFLYTLQNRIIIAPLSRLILAAAFIRYRLLFFINTHTLRQYLRN